jgi:hypothetical protein
MAKHLAEDLKKPFVPRPYTEPPPPPPLSRPVFTPGGAPAIQANTAAGFGAKQ